MGIITNIKSLQSMGIFTDRGADTPSLQFRRYNLVYGFNGSGKSTLSRLFASLAAGEQSPKLPKGATFEITLDDGAVFGCPSKPAGLEHRVLVFNSDYIEQNLQWAAGRASPVFYIGANQAEAASELNRIEEQIRQAEVRQKFGEAAEKAAEKIFSNYKRDLAKLVAGRLHLGSRKYEAPQLTKDYDRWKDDIGPGLTGDQLNIAEEVLKLNAPMPRLHSLHFEKAIIEKAYNFITDVCTQSLATVALAEVQQHPDMLLWLKHGHEYHEAQAITNCLLCGNVISTERRGLLSAALNNSVNDFVSRLNKTAERLNALIETSTQIGSQVPSVQELSSELRATFREVRERLVEDTQLLRAQLSTLKEVLSSKLERPASPVDMNSAAAEADVISTAERLEASVASVNEAIATHNQAITDFEKNKEAAERSIRRHFIQNCHDDYAKAAGELKDATNNLNVEIENISALNKKAVELRQRIRTHGPAAGVINKLIEAYLGHSELTITPLDEGYELQRHGRQITGPPSEGEKTAIAISYFLSSLEADGRKLKDLVVVIDDPVSSLDTKALNFACSLVRTRLEKAAQVFIFTHNLNCMNEFRKAWKSKAKPKNDTQPTATFLYIDVTIQEGHSRRYSKIVEMSKLLREYDSEYHFLFSHVLRFIKQPDAYNDHGYMMPNVIRRVLDVFLAFKCPGVGGLAGQLDKLCSDYPILNRERLAALERLAQVESHSDNLDDLLSFSTMTLEETRGAASALFDMMEQVDGMHMQRLKSLCQ